LDLSNNQFFEIPIDFLIGFPNLKELNLCDNGNLSERDIGFKTLPKLGLRDISLNGCNLKYAPFGLLEFVDTDKMIEYCCEDDEFKIEIPPGLLKHKDNDGVSIANRSTVVDSTNRNLSQIMESVSGCFVCSKKFEEGVEIIVWRATEAHHGLDPYGDVVCSIACASKIAKTSYCRICHSWFETSETNMKKLVSENSDFEFDDNDLERFFNCYCSEKCENAH